MRTHCSFCSAITFAALLLTSCAPVYMPNTLNPHLPRMAKEAHVSAHTGMNDIDLAATYSVTDNIAVMADGSFSNKNNVKDKDYHKHSFGEGGIALYAPLGESGAYNIGMGYGGGTSTSRDNFEFFGNQSLVAEGTYNRFFFQQNIGYVSKYFEILLGTRFSYVQFSHFNIVMAEDSTASSPTFNGTLQSWFFEPAITAKLGGPAFKFAVQTGFSVPMKNNVQFQSQPFLFSVGVELALGNNK